MNTWFCLNTVDYRLELYPREERPWAVAYYGTECETVQGLEEWSLRDPTDLNKTAADLASELYAHLSKMMDYEQLRPMCHLGNYEVFESDEPRMTRFEELDIEAEKMLLELRVGHTECLMAIHELKKLEEEKRDPFYIPTLREHQVDLFGVAI